MGALVMAIWVRPLSVSRISKCLEPSSRGLHHHCAMDRHLRLLQGQHLRLLQGQQPQVSVALEGAVEVVKVDIVGCLKPTAKAIARACGAQVKPALSMSLFEAQRFNSSAHNGVLAFPLFFHFATSFLGTMPF